MFDHIIIFRYNIYHTINNKLHYTWDYGIIQKFWVHIGLLFKEILYLLSFIEVSFDMIEFNWNVWSYHFDISYKYVVPSDI